jgi:putative transposase
LQDFDVAVASGASRYQAAALMGLSERTLKRWRCASGQVVEDKRPDAISPTQGHQLTPEEEVAIMAACNQPAYQSLPPSQIVPLLADQGLYIASVSSFYRVLKKHEQVQHRGRARSAAPHPLPKSFTATGPNQLWSWDISSVPSQTRGQHWYLYLIMDVYSRKIAAWEVHEVESGEHAKDLVQRALLREGCINKPPVLHSDNGAPMTSYTLKARLSELGMLMSYSRPRVSNDNPYSEALFKTTKYCPEWPSQGFESLQAARQWMMTFEQGYNEKHLHSGINFVTPASRHRGEDSAILKNRERIFEEAKAKHPRRWSGATRDWSHIKEVSLNPGRAHEIELNKCAA